MTATAWFTPDPICGTVSGRSSHFAEPTSKKTGSPVVESSEIEALLRAANAAGEVLRRYYKEGVAFRVKAPADLVSDADLHAEEAVVREIRRDFPSDAILGEEKHQGDPDAERLWVIDPLDGTTNFAHRIPRFAVSIALLVQGRPITAVVANPVTNDTYTATAGQGAQHNGVSIRCSQAESLSDVLIACGFYYDRGRMMRNTLETLGEFFESEIRGVRRMGAAALDMCDVASGVFGAFFEYQLSPWDFAAGRLIVEEAGGRASDCRGQPLTTRPSSVLVSASSLYERSLEIVRKRA